MENFIQKVSKKTYDFTEYYSDFDKNEFSNCKFIKTKYTNNGNTALAILDNSENLETLITTNLEIKLPENKVFLKTWGENEGLLDLLLENNIVKLTGEKYKSGFVEVQVAEILIFDDLIVDFVI